MMSFGNVFEGVKLSEKEREKIVADRLKSSRTNTFFIIALTLLVISIITTPYLLKNSYLMLPLLFGEIFMAILVLLSLGITSRKKKLNLVQ